MTKLKNIIWGIVLVAIGVIIALNSLGIASIDLFFDGWWTLFIIIPSFVGLFDKGDKTGDIIGLCIGVALLLACQKVINFGLLWKLALPAVLIVIGLSIIFKGTIDKKMNQRISELKKAVNEDADSRGEYCAVFSGQDINFSNEVFKGAKMTALFGGIKCDLRGATIENDVLIDADAVFGGIDIFPPANVKVKIKSTSIFGGASNKAVFTGDDTSPTIYVNTTCIFGGLDVK